MKLEDNVDLKTGLSEEEAFARLEKYGLNVLPEKPPPSDLSILVSQIKSPLVYVLFAAGMVTFVLGDIPDTIIIGVSVFINTVLSYVQERRANKALYALKKMIHPVTKVVRDEREIQIGVEGVVPGDIVVLSQGEKVPADGVLVEVNRLFADEAILTGESVPVRKRVYSFGSAGYDKIKGRVADNGLKTESKVFMSTVISSGRGLMRVETTGAKTEIGKIAKSIQGPSEDTPLKKQLTRFSKQLSVLVMILVAFVFLVGYLRGFELVEIFETSVALAVSSIPEGMLVGLTIVLAIGMQKILKRRGLVRHLISAETLGGVTTICVDKTGTLTEGRMRVIDVVGDENEAAIQMVLANDHDDALVIAGFEWAINKLKIKNSKIKIGKLLEKYDRLDSIPFSSENRFFTSLHKWDNGTNIIFVNGAPEFILGLSRMTGKMRHEVIGQIEKLAGEGKRVVGLARRKVKSTKKKIKKLDIKGGLEWVGLISFSDLIREGVKEALAKTKKAGIKLVVITGDYPATAESVMNRLGIQTSKDCTIMGSELRKMDSKRLAKELNKERFVNLYARTTPDQKLKIVEALKKNGEVVAMMGDGVNDAPALNKADIGIVVGEAIDVAKESADLVLLDSSFATVVAAVEEGRGIFDNVRKIILYLMCDSFEEIVVVVASIVFSLPLPVTAVQILWINLVSDGFPNLALTVDSGQKDIMSRPPRLPDERLVSNWMKHLILIVSGTGGVIAFLLFLFFYKTTDSLPLSQSIAFATLGVNSLIYVFSIRTLIKPFWKQNLFANNWLNLSVLAGMTLQVLPFTTSNLRRFFGVTTLTFSNWIIILAASIVMFVIIEISKGIFHYFSIKNES